MPSVLFISNDHIGAAMAGPGIRTWELAHAVAEKGHRVVVLSKHWEPGFTSGRLNFVGPSSPANLVTWVWRSDAVVQAGRPLPILLSVLFRKKLIVDQYDPVIFEFLEKRASSPAEKLRKALLLLLWKARQRLLLRFGSRFLVANEKQKDFLIGQLTVLGHLQKIGTVTVLPFGLPRTKPARTRSSVLRGNKIRDKDFLLVWGGGIWDWFDPFSLLQALAKIKQHRDDIKVYFPGVMPPSPDSRKMAVVDRFLGQAGELQLLDSTVFVNDGWTPYDQRADYLLEANAGISLHRDSLETRFAFRTRMLDYLWAGLPIIASQGDSWAGVVEKEGLGLTVPCEDVDALVRAIIRMADDQDLRKRCSESVRRVAGQYSWDELAERLMVIEER